MENITINRDIRRYNKMKMYKDQLNGVTAFENTTKKGETYLTICFLGMKFNCFVPKEKKA